MCILICLDALCNGRGRKRPQEGVGEQQVSNSHQQLLPSSPYVQYIQDLCWVALGLPGVVHGCD